MIVSDGWPPWGQQQRLLATDRIGCVLGTSKCWFRTANETPRQNGSAPVAPRVTSEAEAAVESLLCLSRAAAALPAGRWCKALPAPAAWSSPDVSGHVVHPAVVHPQHRPWVLSRTAGGHKLAWIELATAHRRAPPVRSVRQQAQCSIVCPVLMQVPANQV